ncbi:MAG: radical SAM protein [Bacteroidetes bacterium]|nr:radical SAM protein [Bacteroidota bacterium]
MQAVIDKIGIQLTTKCNLSCAHCSISCRPGKGQTFNSRMMRGVLESASSCGVRFLTLTGGEPLEEETVLQAVLETAKEFEIKTSIVTNAVWAREPRRLQTVLNLLCDLGVSSLDVSYDYYHSKFLGFTTIERLVDSARSTDLPLRVLCGLTRHPGTFEVFRLLSSLPVDVIYYPIQLLGRASSLHRDYLISDSFEDSVCPQAGQPFILADGRVLFCCGLAAFSDTPSFDESAALLGNLVSRSFEEIVSSYLPVQDAVMSYPVSALAKSAGLTNVNQRRASGPSVCSMCYAFLSGPFETSDMTNDLQNHSLFKEILKSPEKHRWPQPSPLLPAFGSPVKLKGPAVLARNALSGWNDLDGNSSRDMQLLGFFDFDNRVTYRFVGPSIAAVIRDLLEGGALPLQDPDEACTSQGVTDVTEYIRRASILLAFEQGLLCTLKQ